MAPLPTLKRSVIAPTQAPSHARRKGKPRNASAVIADPEIIGGGTTRPSPIDDRARPVYRLIGRYL